MKQPSSFDEASDWTLWVLEHGLPKLPGDVGVRECVPVARWVEAEFGAVLTVYHYEDGDDGPQIDYEIEFARRIASSWDLCSGSGGSHWLDPPFARPSLPTFGVQLPGGQTEFASASEGVHNRATDGFVGEGIKALEVVHAQGAITRRPIESPIGAVVVCTSGPDLAVVRALDERGTVRETVVF